MGIITNLTETPHIHEWKPYHGALGYESHVCRVCAIDVNDLRNELALEELAWLRKAMTTLPQK